MKFLGLAKRQSRALDYARNDRVVLEMTRWVALEMTKASPAVLEPGFDLYGYDDNGGKDKQWYIAAQVVGDELTEPLDDTFAKCLNKLYHRNDFFYGKITLQEFCPFFMM